MLSFAAKWVELADIMVNETNGHRKTATKCSFSYVDVEKFIQHVC